jgi:hypothetical protein
MYHVCVCVYTIPGRLFFLLLHISFCGFEDHGLAKGSRPVDCRKAHVLWLVCTRTTTNKIWKARFAVAVHSCETNKFMLENQITTDVLNINGHCGMLYIFDGGMLTRPSWLRCHGDLEFQSVLIMLSHRYSVHTSFIMLRGIIQTCCPTCCPCGANVF